MHIKTNYSLLAFLVCLKQHRRNSMLYSWESGITLARQFGMGYNTFKKYRKLALQEGYLLKEGPHQRAIRLVTALERLGLKSTSEKDNGTLTRHHRFFREDIKAPATFKEVYKKIVRSLLLVNYQRQAYHIQQKEYQTTAFTNDRSLRTRGDKVAMRRFLREAHREGASYQEYFSRTLETIRRGIISGKHHVASLLGYSAKSGTNWLRHLTEGSYIHREIIVHHENHLVSHATYDYLRVQYPGKTIVPYPLLNKFLVYLGSRVTILPLELKEGLLLNTTQKQQLS